MNDARLTSTLPRIVEHVSQRRQNQDQALTIFDLRVGIRDIRMSEITDWSNDDLEVVEAHVSRFGDDAAVESVVNFPVDDNLAACASAASTHGTPSPFAWM